MDRSLRLGSAVLGAGMMGFGTLNLLRLDLVPDVQPLPAWVPGRVLWACLSGVVLLVAGAGLVASWRARAAAFTIATFLSLWVLVLHVPRLAADPASGGAWVGAFEALALAATAWMLTDTLTVGDRWRTVSEIARIALGVAFLAFGTSHVIYRPYVESVIPAWIPAHRFWAYATGAAHFAAGVSLLTRVQARLATTMLAIMFGTWVVILHVPRAAANAGRANEWASLLVALSMCGGAWVASASRALANVRVSRPRVSAIGGELGVPTR